MKCAKYGKSNCWHVMLLTDDGSYKHPNYRPYDTSFCDGLFMHDKETFTEGPAPEGSFCTECISMIVYLATRTTPTDRPNLWTDTWRGFTEDERMELIRLALREISGWQKELQEKTMTEVIGTFHRQKVPGKAEECIYDPPCCPKCGGTWFVPTWLPPYGGLCGYLFTYCTTCRFPMQLKSQDEATDD